MTVKQNMEQEQAKQKAASLTERLRMIDEFNQKIPVSMENRPKGYDPMKSLDAWLGSQSTRNSTQESLNSELLKLAGYQDQEDPYDKLAKILDVESKAKDLGKAISYDENGNPTAVKEGDKESLEIIDLIQDIRSQDLGPLTGVLRLRSAIPGTTSFDTKQKITQLRDKLALKARAAIKGTGTISDIEQEMLKNAQTLLQPGLTEQGFKAELDKLEENARRQAGTVTDTDSKVNQQVGDFTIKEIK